MHRTRSTYILANNHPIHPWQKGREGAGRDRRACAGHRPLGADRTVGSFGSVSAGKPTCKKTNVFKIQRHLQKEVPTSFGIEFVTVPTECKRVLRFASVTPHSNVRDADLPFRRF